MFHSFSVFKQDLCTYLSFCSLSVLLGRLPGRQSPLFSRFAFFFLCWLSLRLVVWPGLGDPFVSQIPEKFVRLIFRDIFLVVHIPFVNMVKFQFLAQFPVDHLSIQLCLVLYSLCGNLLHSLIMWLMVLYLLSYNLHLLFCYVLCMLWRYALALFCAAQRRISVSFSRFPFLSHDQVFS